MQCNKGCCFEGRLVVLGLLLRRDVQRFQGGLVFKTLRLCVSLNLKLKSCNKEGEEGLLKRLLESNVRCRAKREQLE